MKVRMITPLPLVEVPSKVGVGFVESVRREYEVLMVKEQKRVIEVVRKSKVCGGWDDEWVSCSVAFLEQGKRETGWRWGGEKMLTYV